MLNYQNSHSKIAIGITKCRRKKEAEEDKSCDLLSCPGKMDEAPLPYQPSTWDSYACTCVLTADPCGDPVLPFLRSLSLTRFVQVC